MNETLQTLKKRRSNRSYRPEQIADRELNAILEAGTYAPTGNGRQSPVMVVVQDPETLALLSRVNAEIMGKPDAAPFYGAPTAVVVLADGRIPTWLQDGALVMGNLMNAAASLGVASCWINRAKETFEREEGRLLLKKWGVPETLCGVGYCILGYAAEDPPAASPRKEGYIVRP